MTKYLFILLYMAVALISCKKDKPENKALPTYTIQGRILDGATMKPYKNVPLQIVVNKGTGMQFEEQELGNAVTNDTGTFKRG